MTEDQRQYYQEWIDTAIRLKGTRLELGLSTMQVAVMMGFTGKKAHERQKLINAHEAAGKINSPEEFASMPSNKRPRGVTKILLKQYAVVYKSNAAYFAGLSDIPGQSKLTDTDLALIEASVDGSFETALEIELIDISGDHKQIMEAKNNAKRIIKLIKRDLKNSLLLNNNIPTLTVVNQ
jgi:hypothetical protein